MVSKYDVFYVIATKGSITPSGIVEALHKQKEEYNAIFNHVAQLAADGYVKKNEAVKVVHDDRTKALFNIISFCIRNNINYNILLSQKMLFFLEKASKKEKFTIKNIKVHPQTFKNYIETLARYGFLLVLSRKPLKAKLLRHHFIAELLKFFNRDATFYAPKKHSFIDEIEKESRIYRKNQKTHHTVRLDMEKEEKTGFIYSSLNLEGNPLTLPETQKLIENDIVPAKHKLAQIQEVTDYKKAVDLMLTNADRKIKPDLQLILEYHRIAMNHASGAGEIRKHNVRIRGNPEFKTSDWREIHQKISAMLKKYEEFSMQKTSIEQAIEFAAYFHNEFQRIHPFNDGNSRTSRLLLLHILRSCNLPVLDLPLGYFDTYMDLTKRSTRRDDKAFAFLIQEIVLMNLKRMNARQA